jgi:Uma2 family endonuclease
MAIAAPGIRATLDQYFDREAVSERRHEFHDGEVLAMAGASPEHSLIAANLLRAIGNRLSGKPCRAYDSNLRVRSHLSNRYVYSDVTVICGKVELDPRDPRPHTAINPALVIEIASPFTEIYDRTEKFDGYREIPSLREYAIVIQYHARVETYRRGDDGQWVFGVAVGLDAEIELASVGITLPLREVYDQVELSSPGPVTGSTVGDASA